MSEPTLSSTLSESSEPQIIISIAALGQWTTLPEIHSRFELSLEEVEDSWREDLIQQGWDNEVFEKPLLKKLRTLPQVIFGELSFKPYIEESAEGHFPSRQLRWAKVTAKTLRNLSINGAQALYFDASAKAYTPDMFEQLDVNDHATLFHLFVEIWCEQDRVLTEGMSLFGLPDLCIVGFEANSSAAQATAFSLGAQLVCDELKVKGKQHFRASESFPLCSLEWLASEQEALQFLNQLNAYNDEFSPSYPCGLLVARAL